MTTHNLRYLFKPASVALIGASERPGSVGAALTRNLLAGGFQGDLFLVNRRHAHVQGMPACRRVVELPRAPELAVIATPPSTVAELLTELGRWGVQAAIVVTTTADSSSHVAGPKLKHAMQDAVRPYGLRLLGPNSLGVMTPRRGFNASLGHLPPRPGHLAFIAQSGAVITPVLEWATLQGIGFSSIVSLGDMADVDFGDLLDWLAHDPDTHAILLYLETLGEARKFLSAARGAARLKPVVVVRAGRYGDAAARQCDALYDAAFRRAGMLRVQSLRELFWAAQTLALDLPVTGDRLAIVGNSAGLGRLARDTLLKEGGQLATFAPATHARLQAALPARIPKNPLDLGDDASGVQFAAALDSLLPDSDIDGILVLHSPNAVVRSEETAAAVIEALRGFRQRGGRPRVLTCWLGSDSAKAARQRFLDQRIPSYDTADDAVRAFMQRWRHQRNQAALMETPPNLPELFTADFAAARQVAQAALAAGRDELTETETTTLLSAYGIVASQDGAVTTPQPSPQPLELLIRVVSDPTFGPVLLFGPSGPSALLLDHCAAALPPLNLVLAREALAHTPVQRLLLHNRNEPASTALLDAVALLLVKIAQIVIDLSEISELELDPVLVTADRVTVGTAQIRVVATSESAQQRLAIRPYPRELEETLPLPDGSTLYIRPVRPEDEPAFQAGFARLSPDEIRMRFMHIVKELTHTEAARLTQIDYDREMALVALRQRPDHPPEGCGVARIISDPDRDSAEFAIILLRDATGIGLSALLLRRLIQYARKQGIRELVGEILRENDSMLELCRAMGFTVKVCPDDSGVMIATLRLD